LGKLIETHASWVFLGDEFVYKFKKPVNFGFLDFSSLEKRKTACEAEVRLNSRLAPRVYLGTVAVKRVDDLWFVDDPDAPGLRPAEPSEAEQIDVGVKMRRLPDDERADVLVSRGALGVDLIDAVAQLLSHFHDRCSTSREIANWGSAGAIRKNVEENFEQTRHLVHQYLEEQQVGTIERLQHRFLDEHELVLTRRVEGGFIRAKWLGLNM
jgi:aminoglycoside phosphotransferase family enzyme